MDLVSALVGSVLDLGIDRLVQRLADAKSPLTHAINRIEDNTERQLLAPLKEGLSYLDLEEFTRARDRLIAAEALDDLAPVPRLLLGLTLIELGSHKQGADRLLASLELNPFIAPEILALPAAHTVLQASGARGPSVVEMNLPSAIDGTGSIQLRDWRRRVPRALWRLGPSACITRLAMTPGRSSSEAAVAMQWSSDGVLPAPEHLAVFRVPSGGMSWYTQLDKSEEILLVTPRLVATQCQELDRRRVKVRSLDSDGTPSADVSLEYFTTMFAPNLSEDPPDAYKRTHAALVKPDLESVRARGMAQHPDWGPRDLRRILPVRVLAEMLACGRDTVVRYVDEEIQVQAYPPFRMEVHATNRYHVARRATRPVLIDVFCKAHVAWGESSSRGDASTEGDSAAKS
jgi:hypothetical protein